MSRTSPLRRTASSHAKETSCPLRQDASATAGVQGEFRLGVMPAKAQTASTAPTGGYERLTTIALPGKPLLTCGISFVDPALHLYYLSDRTNAGVDVIDTRTNRFLVRVTGNATVGEFSGQQASNNFSGPNGVAPADSGRVWAGDGDSTVKIMDLFTAQVVGSINTGGTARANEMSYDPRDHIMPVSNEADSPPFISLISTWPGRERILARITFQAATNGVQAPICDPRNGLFYVNVPQIGTDPTKGEVAVIDPRTATVVKTFPVSDCQAVGMALGPRRNLLLGCWTLTNSVASPALPTQVIDDFGGAATAILPRIGGTDEAWYDPGNKTHLIAARCAAGGSMLGVIDARTNAFLGSVPAGKGSHSVAADPDTNHVFVPLPANPADPDCPSGCVGVYGRRG